MANCIHNNRCRYTHGFHCYDCNTFFGKETATYRSDEMLCSISMVLNNINTDLFNDGKAVDDDVAELKNRIGFNKKHDNYEDLISEAEVLMKKHEKTSDSASITLCEE